MSESLSHLPSWLHSQEARRRLSSGKLQSPSSCNPVSWHWMTWFSLSPHSDTIGQGLLIHSSVSSFLPWSALLMRTSSLPWSQVSLLCSGKYIPTGLNHPRGLLAPRRKQSSHSGPRNNLQKWKRQEEASFRQIHSATKTSINLQVYAPFHPRWPNVDKAFRGPSFQPAWHSQG